jgi:alkylation response protein AidB-like acyl-CoA dehydrogenase
MTVRHEAPFGRADRADWPAAARALGAMIASHIPEIDRSGSLPPSLLDALHDAMLFRILLPRSFGGGEADPITYAQTVEELAKADASTAWCVGQAAGCSFSAAYLDPSAAREIFAAPNAVVAWGPATAHSKAVAVEGGYRVTGSWNYASGSRHATWLGAHCAIHEKDGSPRLDSKGKHVEKTMLFPRSVAQITDIWRVMGLKGTGSDNYALSDQFIPERFTYERDSSRDRREKGSLYQFGILSTYGMAFASVALGVARSMLDEFIDLASRKAAKGAPKVLRENAVVQALVGASEAKLRGSRAFLHTSIGEMWNSCQSGEKPTLDQRVNLRLASTYAIRQSCEVTEEVYAAAGATAIFEDQGFERKFRDMHAVSQQIQGQTRNYETVGQVILGLAGENPRI